MSNFSDVKALLIRNREMHDRTADFYTFLAKQVVSERVKMFLGTLVKHEYDLAKELDNYLEQAPDSILDTFFQFDHNQDIDTLYLTAFTPSECSANDVEVLATRFDDYLCQLYEEMIRIADNSKVRALFENLYQHMQLEKKRLSTDIYSIWDI